MLLEKDHFEIVIRSQERGTIYRSKCDKDSYEIELDINNKTMYLRIDISEVEPYIYEMGTLRFKILEQGNSIAFCRSDLSFTADKIVLFYRGSSNGVIYNNLIKIPSKDKEGYNYYLEKEAK